MTARPATNAAHAVDATPFVPKDPRATLAQLQRAAEGCRGCDLYKRATHVVFGELASHDGKKAERSRISVPLMLLGEQPGNDEDLEGRPFVGPAGKLLDKALEEAGVERSRVYVTNAVKHFNWKPAPRGKRRLHSKPNAAEVRACRPWLEREIAMVNPGVIVCLGATAGQTLFGSKFRVGAMRGRHIPTPDDLAPLVGAARLFATIHPSAVLRMPDHDERQREYELLVRDLRTALKLAKS